MQKSLRLKHPESRNNKEQHLLARHSMLGKTSFSASHAFAVLGAVPVLQAQHVASFRSERMHSDVEPALFGANLGASEAVALAQFV